MKRKTFASRRSLIQILTWIQRSKHRKTTIRPWKDRPLRKLPADPWKQRRSLTSSTPPLLPLRGFQSWELEEWAWRSQREWAALPGVGTAATSTPASTPSSRSSSRLSLAASPKRKLPRAEPYWISQTKLHRLATKIRIEQEIKSSRSSQQQRRTTKKLRRRLWSCRDRLCSSRESSSKRRDLSRKMKNLRKKLRSLDKS